MVPLTATTHLDHVDPKSPVLQGQFRKFVSGSHATGQFPHLRTEGVGDAHQLLSAANRTISGSLLAVILGSAQQNRVRVADIFP